MSLKAFLAAIHENPEDDDLRLVFADWLEERGDCARAEFIRVGCQLERLPAEDPGRRVLCLRERELLRMHNQDWFNILSSDPTLISSHRSDGTGEHLGGLEYWDARRGFIDVVHADCRLLLRLADGLFANHPVRRLLLHLGRDEHGWYQEDAAARDLQALCGCRYLARLGSLELRGYFRARIVLDLSGEANLGKLQFKEFKPMKEYTWGRPGPAVVSFAVPAP